MAEITPIKKNLFEQELDFKSGIAERTWFKIGSSINHINNFQHMTFQFNFNGLTRLFVDIAQGKDGVFPCLFNMDIAGISVYQRKGGSSGQTTIDIKYRATPGGAATSIFTTKPVIDSNAVDNSYMIFNSVDDTDVEKGVGFTAPVFDKKEFDAGDILELYIDEAMPDSEDLMVMVHYRPR